MTNNTIIIEKVREIKNGVFSEIKNKLTELNELRKKINSTNLKLHELSYLIYDYKEQGLINESEIENLFSIICNFEYEKFTEWEEENLHYVKREYIGRTSSFYYSTDYYGNILDNDVIEDLLKGIEVDMIDVIGCINHNLYDVLMINSEIDFNEYDLFDLENEEDDLNAICDDLDDVLEIINESLRAYNYIESFKTAENAKGLIESYINNN